jgi:hypothetical protein
MSDDIEHRIEEVIDELAGKAMYWKRLGWRAIDEIRRLRVVEADLTKQINELKGRLNDQ